MATIRLPPDFREFLQLPNENGVEYTMSDRYAVGHYGPPWAPGDGLCHNTTAIMATDPTSKVAKIKLPPLK